MHDISGVFRCFQTLKKQIPKKGILKKSQFFRLQIGNIKLFVVLFKNQYLIYEILFKSFNENHYFSYFTDPPPHLLKKFIYLILFHFHVFLEFTLINHIMFENQSVPTNMQLNRQRSLYNEYICFNLIVNVSFIATVLTTSVSMTFVIKFYVPQY